MHTIDRPWREHSGRVEETRATRLGNRGVGRPQSTAGRFAAMKEKVHERRELAERWR